MKKERLGWIMRPEALKRFQELVARSFAGEVTDEEWKEVTTELSKNPENWEPLQ